MKPLYTQIEYNKAKSIDELPCKCYQCDSIFYSEKRRITRWLTKGVRAPKYCSKNCQSLSQIKKKNISCTNCDYFFEIVPSDFKKSSNHFCSQSCSTIYNNKHKTTGNRRSKLEKYIEEQLTILYPKLEIHFNRKDTIDSELDIYVPSLNLAFELNGIFHYEPIYGVDKFQQIQLNDVSKSKACHDAKIDLCVIDSSQQKYVKPSTSQKYLDIITDIIKQRL